MQEGAGPELQRHPGIRFSSQSGGQHGTQFQPAFFHEDSDEIPDLSGVKYAWQRVTARTTRPSPSLSVWSVSGCGGGSPGAAGVWIGCDDLAPYLQDRFQVGGVDDGGEQVVSGFFEQGARSSGL